MGRELTPKACKWGIVGPELKTIQITTSSGQLFNRATDPKENNLKRGKNKNKFKN